jgi:TRAP-type uncharacterized transport system substrate-binding protein
MSDTPAKTNSAPKPGGIRTGGRRPLYRRFHSGPSWWESIRGWWPWMFLLALLLAVGWLFVKPAPPGRVVIATGPVDGSYYWFAERYAKSFEEAGVTLELRPSEGSVDNYRILESTEANAGPRWLDDGVSSAIVQSGTCPEGLNANLHAVASLYLEPIWIFHRGPPEWQLADLRGKRVAVGPDGSGARSLMGRLLSINKIPFGPATATASTTAPATALATAPTTQPATAPSADPVYLSPEGGRAAIEALRDRRVDAAVFVFSPRHPFVKELLSDPALHLMSFDRREAYTRIFPFLQDVRLPRGTVDLARDLPREDLCLLSPAANLVCRTGTHPAIVGLLVKAAQATHERGDLISPPGKMPSTQYIEFPIDPAAAEYFKSGPPFLQRILPFWAAAFVDRMKILILPLLTLLIPLSRLAPPLYVWRTRSKIYRWYRVLREIDHRLREDAKAASPTTPAASGDASTLPPVDPSLFVEDLATLNEMEQELTDQKVPLSYMEEFYNLRLHTDFLRRRVERRVGSGRRRGEEG